MHQLAPSSGNSPPVFRFGPAAIGVGLAILMAAVLWPGVPAATAMALVTLGATTVMTSRFRGSASLLPIMLTHCLVYGGLYSLFVGAALHQSPPHPNLLLADLALSICLVAATLKLIRHELRMNTLAE